MGLFDKFLRKYPPSGELLKPSKDIIKICRSQNLPEELIEFWNTYGCGNYGDGIIKVINPEDYVSSLYEWLGNKDISRIPIFMTGFGDIFYYRNLGEEYDISLLDIHYRKIDVCTYTLEEFLRDFIVDEEIEKDSLRKELFEEAKKKSGNLLSKEIYFFAPALIIGGVEEIKHIDKGNAVIHQSILLQF